jgi:hypothetical protein
MQVFSTDGPCSRILRLGQPIFNPLRKTPALQHEPPTYGPCEIRGNSSSIRFAYDRIPERTAMRCLTLLFLCAAAQAALAQPNAPAPVDGCGEVVTISTHFGTTTRYAFAPAIGTPAQSAPIALVMLIGGGYINLDEQGCPRLLSRNVLARMRPLLHDAGVVTVLVDAPSDMKSDEGLGRFRIAADHASCASCVAATTKGTKPDDGTMSR